MRKTIAALVVATAGAMSLAAVAEAQSCPGDNNGDGVVTVDEIVAAVNAALSGCPAPPPTFSPSPTNTPTETSQPTPTATETPSLTATPSATETSTPTATPTLTPTTTATPSATPTPLPTDTPLTTATWTPSATPTVVQVPPAVVVGHVAGNPGTTVEVTVTLFSGTYAASGANVEIAFDAMHAPIARREDGSPDCRIGTTLPDTAAAFVFRPAGCFGSDCTSVFLAVFPTFPIRALPTVASLFTCSVAVAPGAAAGSYPLDVSGLIVSDQSGNAITSATGVNGAVEVAASPTATPTPTATRTPTVLSNGSCGNGLVELGEDCDNGGLCIGGSNAGTACTAEADCNGNGICVGGTFSGASCADDSNCGGGECKRCRPFGGNGCAANCTNERVVSFTLQPGVTDAFGSDIVQGSGVVIVSLLELGLPMTGQIVVIVGEERNGQIPVRIPGDGLDTPAIPVLGLACACISGVAAKTCGGVAFEADGVTVARDCTDHDSVCPAGAPCAFVHGPGNSASGVVGCNGLVGTDLNAVLEDGELTIARSGSGGSGSTSILTSIGIGLLLGPCTESGPDYGPDGQFCTADDPPNENSATGTGLLTTGEACGTALGDFQIGPFCRTGVPASCSAIGAEDSMSGTCIVTSLPFADVPQLGDLVGAVQFCAQ